MAEESGAGPLAAALPAVLGPTLSPAFGAEGEHQRRRQACA
jgi:hypothetical protein